MSTRWCSEMITLSQKTERRRRSSSEQRLSLAQADKVLRSDVACRGLSRRAAAALRCATCADKAWCQSARHRRLVLRLSPPSSVGRGAQAWTVFCDIIHSTRARPRRLGFAVKCCVLQRFAVDASEAVHGGEGVAAEHERGGRRRGRRRIGVAALARGHLAAQRRARGPPRAARQVSQRTARAIPHRAATRTAARHRRHCLLFLQVCRHRPSNVNVLLLSSVKSTRWHFDGNFPRTSIQVSENRDQHGA